jgi:ribosome recycling factor
MIKDLLRETENKMKKTIEVLDADLRGIRTGRATPALVERLMVDYYGVPTPLEQLATISVPEPQLLAIRPYDPASTKGIERAILASELGLTPNNDGKLIRLVIPRLTQERRIELGKIVKKRVEAAHISVRNLRRDAMNDIRDFEKEKLVTEDEAERGREDLEKLTKRYIDKVDESGVRKEKEIAEV